MRITRLCSDTDWQFAPMADTLEPPASPLHYAVTELVTAILEKEAALGIVLGGIAWDAGAAAGAAAQPRGRSLDSLPLPSLVGTVVGAARYVQDLQEQETRKHLAGLTAAQRLQIMYRFATWFCRHCGEMFDAAGNCACRQDACDE